MATAGLIYLTPRLTSKLKFLPARLGVRDLTATTLAAQLAVLPWLVLKTGQWSWLALPINLLALPVVPYAMLFGFLTIILSFPFGFLAWLLSAYILTIADWGARLF